MPVLARLVQLYRIRGIDIAIGLNPARFGGFDQAAFTWFVKDGESLTEGLGIAALEVYFLECLFARFHPKSMFVVGNSLGWSTFAIALANPVGRVLAIDAGFDRRAREGIGLTNRVAAEEGLAIRVVAGTSPEDVPAIVAAEAMPPIEFAFIDGYHSAEHVALDFRAVRAHADPGCIYLFHDVETFALAAGVEQVAAQFGLRWDLLAGTTSGMAIAYDPARSPSVQEDIAPFITTPDAVAVIRAAAWNNRHRHLARWRRSLRKRLGRAPSPLPALDEP
jgi:predicted O-methyltransferase YrrM